MIRREGIIIGSALLAMIAAAIVTFPRAGRDLRAHPDAVVVNNFQRGDKEASARPESIAASVQPQQKVAVADEEPPLRHEVAVTAIEPAHATAMAETETPPGPDTVASIAPTAQIPSADSAPAPASPPEDLTYLADYAYSEVLPDTKPADVVLATLKDVPVGTPVEEIKRASDAFGLDFTFMKAVARIESDFDPKERTGSYIGLFQLSRGEFAGYGDGDITSPRDNAIAATYKFAVAAKLFEIETHKKPTLFDLYLIHQQGWQGAAEHISHPERTAWKSMCATDEGMEKGERWCKRAIWLNTLPDIKRLYKSVDNLTSGAFVDMWKERVAHFYARYSEAISQK